MVINDDANNGSVFLNDRQEMKSWGGWTLNSIWGFLF